MIEIIECGQGCVEVRHKKWDDFIAALEFFKAEENNDSEPFDVSLVNMKWDIMSGTETLVEIQEDDLTIENNNILFRKPSWFFEYFKFSGTYYHRLYDTVSNTTFFEGKFLLQSQSVYITPNPPQQNQTFPFTLPLTLA